MNCIKPFNEVKCEKCDTNGFIIIDGKAMKCECRKIYDDKLKLYNALYNGNVINESSDEETFEEWFTYNFDERYHGEDKNNNIKKLKKYVNEFDFDKKIKLTKIVTSENGVEETVEQCKSLPKFKNTHLLLWGDRGTQKSYTIKGTLSLLGKKGYSIYYITLKSLIDLIMESDRDESKKDKLNYILNVDVLVIDEFTHDSVNFYSSGYKQTCLVSPLKMRLEIIRKSTIFISNDSPQEIRDGVFGDTIGDCVIRETKFTQMEFTDNYTDNLSKEEIDEICKGIWND